MRNMAKMGEEHLGRESGEDGEWIPPRMPLKDGKRIVKGQREGGKKSATEWRGDGGDNVKNMQKRWRKDSQMVGRRWGNYEERNRKEMRDNGENMKLEAQKSRKRILSCGCLKHIMMRKSRVSQNL